MSTLRLTDPAMALCMRRAHRAGLRGIDSAGYWGRADRLLELGYAERFTIRRRPRVRLNDLGHQVAEVLIEPKETP